MDDLTTRRFGLLIAYIVPGFVMLVGIGSLSEPVWGWLVGVGVGGPSFGAVLYVAVASVAAGMTASVLRWAVLDTLHRITGLRRPALDESRLAERLDAYDYLVEQHYRYYQFYGNTLVAVVLAFAMWRASPHSAALPVGWPESVLIVLTGVFAAGSRDALRKYYSGGELLLGKVPHRRRRRMTNGKHHPSHQKPDQPKPTTKSATRAVAESAGSSRSLKREPASRKL